MSLSVKSWSTFLAFEIEQIYFLKSDFTFSGQFWWANEKVSKGEKIKLLLWYKISEIWAHSDIAQLLLFKSKNKETKL